MKRFMNYIPVIARLLLGAVFLIFGLNGFLNFIPMPPPQGAAGQFMGGLAAAGYFFPLLKITEIAVGVLLLSGRFVPLALILLAPISVNIFGFHLALDASGMPMALFIGVAQLYLAWVYRDAFRTVLASRAEPHREPEEQRRSHNEPVPVGG